MSKSRKHARGSPATAREEEGGGRNEAVHSWGLRGVSHEERKAGVAGGERLDENPCLETCPPSLASVAWK